MTDTDTDTGAAAADVVPAAAIRTVAVLGAGTMGHGIAQVVALAGMRVVIRDLEPELVEAARQRIRASLDTGVDKGKVAPAERDAALERITGTTAVADAVGPADAVIEAVPEAMQLKQSTFQAVEKAAPARALLATNTSSLSIAGIAAALERPERLVGMHFFNPVHIMKLVEVVHHPTSLPGAVAGARALAERLGKTAIAVRDAPGFASSRLGLALGLEAMRMLEQGVASASDIDTAMKLGYGHPIGPLELTDLVGLDVRLAIADNLAAELGPAFAAPGILRAKVAAGKLGKKSGEGFYDWSGRGGLR